LWYLSDANPSCRDVNDECLLLSIDQVWRYYENRPSADQNEVPEAFVGHYDVSDGPHVVRRIEQTLASKAWETVMLRGFNQQLFTTTTKFDRRTSIGHFSTGDFDLLHRQISQCPILSDAANARTANIAIKTAIVLNLGRTDFDWMPPAATLQHYSMPTLFLLALISYPLHTMTLSQLSEARDRIAAAVRAPASQFFRVLNAKEACHPHHLFARLFYGIPQLSWTEVMFSLCKGKGCLKHDLRRNPGSMGGRTMPNCTVRGSIELSSTTGSMSEAVQDAFRRANTKFPFTCDGCKGNNGKNYGAVMDRCPPTLFVRVEQRYEVFESIGGVADCGITFEVPYADLGEHSASVEYRTHHYRLIGLVLLCDYDVVVRKSSENESADDFALHLLVYRDSQGGMWEYDCGLEPDASTRQATSWNAGRPIDSTCVVLAIYEMSAAKTSSVDLNVNEPEMGDEDVIMIE
jgi:hypothetical protein